MMEMTKCINCGEDFEEKEGFVVAEGYDTGVCIPCQKELGKEKFNELVKKEYGG